MENTNDSQNAIARFCNRQVILRASLAFWLISLALPALISSNSRDTLFGIEILSIGWLGVIGGKNFASLLGGLAWWANPLYLFALIKLRSKNLPEKSVYWAVGLSALSVLVSNYAADESVRYAPIIGYGPGALLWFLAILCLTYVVTRGAGRPTAPKLVVCATALIFIAYFTQVAWRGIASNESERDKLPYYSAKRGPICSATAAALPIVEEQSALALEAENEYWLESLRNWGVAAVQIRPTEYTRAPEGSPESRKPPYMIGRPILSPARYTLRAKGGYPYINQWGDAGDVVRLDLIDNRSKRSIGNLVFRREMNRDLGFCPSLNKSPKSPNEEAVRWLEPFLVGDETE